MFSTSLTIASAATFTTLLIHLVAGGRAIAAPLMHASDLHRIVKLTMYYCWHIVSLLLFLLGASLGYAAFRDPNNTPLVMLCLLLAAGCALWSLGLALGTRTSLWHLPQWTLFVAISAPIIWHLARG